MSYGVDATTKGYYTFGGIESDGGGTTEYMRIDSSGNVGIGVTPSAWGDSARVALQVNSASIDSTGNSQMLLRSNNYYDGTDSIYVNSAAAAAYQQLSGVHAWFTAASGTAGTAVSFSESMRIDSSGRVGIGCVPANTLHLVGSSATPSLRLGSTSLNYFWDIGRENQSTGDFLIGNAQNSTSATNRFRINNAGMTSTQSIGYNLDSLVEPATVATSRVGGTSATFNYVLDSNNSAWSTFNLWVVVSTVSGGAAGDAGAWYMIAGRHYGGNMGASVRDSGGNTGDFTVTVSDQGGTDPISVRLAITGMESQSVATATMSNRYGVVSVS
jgi:hypothetical protein